jgi:putative ABC transport system permease protein
MANHRSPKLLLLALALAVLGGACSGGSHADRPIIGVVQVSSVGPLDEAREGFYRAMADSGFVRDVNVTFLERNAQGDIPTLSLIMREFMQQGATQVATLSSIATQTAMKVITDRPIIFGAVANPYIINAGTSPTSHRPNVTGAEIPLPVDSALAVANSTFPQVRGVWGTLFDPADPFAEHYLGVARRKAEQLGIKFLTVACTSPQDIATGVQALRAQGANGIMQVPSVMIGGGFPALVKQARELGIPVVASNTGMEGAPLAIGASFFDNGYQQGLIMIRVLRGESPASIPFKVSANPEMIIDLGAAADLGVTIPKALIDRASKVIPVKGAGDTVQAGSPNAASSATPSRKTSPWDFWLSAFVLGVAFASLAWGVYIASRVLRFPDITPDGSFPLGAAVAATMIIKGVDPLVATAVAFVAGMIAGYVTGLLHTRLKVNELLAGILVMTALYSVNLHVMGRSNISLLDKATLATRLHSLVPATNAWTSDITFGVVFLVLMLVLGLALTWFLRTDFGTAMRAAGDNGAMIIAQGVDRRGMVELALALANGLVAISGALIAQYQGFADVTMGVGTLVAGMAAVILGETLKPKRWRLGATIFMAAVGAVMFRGLIAIALRVGLDPIDLKLATAAFVLATLALPNLGFGRRQGGGGGRGGGAKR